MKRLFVLTMILALLLCGCQSNTSATSTEGKNEANQQSTTATPQAIDDDALANSVTADASTRIPPAANYSGMANRLTSLSAAKLWGDSLSLRQCDLSSADLTNELNGLSKLVFDTATKWPTKLPNGFDPKAIMETGKNSGLGIRNLHAKGITGKGVNIAIIDTTLLLEHEEYCNQIKFYGEVNSAVMADMHGPLVSSISLGKTTGVAPDAGLYFVSTSNVTTVNDTRVLDYTNYAKSIYKLLKVNESLPNDQKIRVLSLSVAWQPELKGYKELTTAIEKAKEAGIFVISCNLFETYDFWTYSLEKDSYSNPDLQDSYKPYEWNSWMKMQGNIDGFQSYYETSLDTNFNGTMLLVPIGSRTVASPTGKNEYSFSSDGGWSTMEPYLAGLYAMACQVKPDITPELFWKTALETGDSREITKGDEKYPASMLNPEKLIANLQK